MKHETPNKPTDQLSQVPKNKPLGIVAAVTFYRLDNPTNSIQAVRVQVLNTKLNLNT